MKRRELKMTKKKYQVGYTTGVYDLFHIGHLNLLKKAKDQCEYLIVGVTIDELVSYKNKEAIIPFEERLEIVKQISYVDAVVPQVNMNKMEAWYQLDFDAVFVGDDWKGTSTWNQFEKEFREVGVTIEYLPYTKGTSSTHLRKTLETLNRR